MPANYKSQLQRLMAAVRELLDAPTSDMAHAIMDLAEVYDQLNVVNDAKK